MRQSNSYYNNLLNIRIFLPSFFSALPPAGLPIAMHDTWLHRKGSCKLVAEQSPQPEWLPNRLSAEAGAKELPCSTTDPGEGQLSVGRSGSKAGDGNGEEGPGSGERRPAARFDAERKRSCLETYERTASRQHFC